MHIETRPCREIAGMAIDSIRKCCAPEVLYSVFHSGMEEYSGTISTSWISHAIVDAVIFAIDYDIVREVLV